MQQNLMFPLLTIWLLPLLLIQDFLLLPQFIVPGHSLCMCEKSISNIELEKNPASLETALRLAAYFKVSVEDIFHLEEEHTT